MSIIVREKGAGEKTQSNALWPKGTSVGCKWGTQITTDKHYSEAHARAVCEMLRVEGFGGGRRIFPLMVWVSEPSEGKPQLPEDA
jgi:hypothetical protein